LRIYLYHVCPHMKAFPKCHFGITYLTENTARKKNLYRVARSRQLTWWLQNIRTPAAKEQRFLLYTKSPRTLRQSSTQWPSGLRRRSTAERLLGSWIRIPPGGMDVCLFWVFVLSGRGLCDGPIPRPEESYWLWCVYECDQVKNKQLDTYCE
jgi:hypothetical protein